MPEKLNRDARPVSVRIPDPLGESVLQIHPSLDTKRGLFHYLFYNTMGDVRPRRHVSSGQDGREDEKRFQAMTRNEHVRDAEFT